MRKVATILLVAFLSGCTYSDGERTGVVQKISKKGVIFKTVEGELVTEGIKSGTKVITNVWAFSASAESFPALKEAAESGEKVTLSYEQNYFQLPWNGDTQYIVNKIVSK